MFEGNERKLCFRFFAVLFTGGFLCVDLSVVGVIEEVLSSDYRRAFAASSIRLR